MLKNNLPQLMAEQKVSIRRLSKMTGVTYTTIRAVYHGERRSIQLDVLEAICQALKVEPGDIYTMAPGGDLSGRVLSSDRSSPGDKPKHEGKTPQKKKPLQSKKPDKKRKPATDRFHEDWREW